MSIKGLLDSFRWAGAGLWYALSTQRNMRIHLILALVAFTLSFYLELNTVEWAILLQTIAFVWFAEMINTVIETTLDFVSKDIHPQIKIAKDVAAGAVLVSSIFALGIGLCLWGTKVLALL